MTAPLIGITGRRTSGDRQIGFLSDMAGADLDLYFADYTRGVIEAGGIPVYLPLEVDIADVIDRLDGVLVSGGADIDPARYGAGRDPDVFVVEPERDEHELALLAAAIDAERPVLGICRGLQVINVHFGGTLRQHVPDHTRYDVGVDRAAHGVTIEPGSILGSLYGTSADVNSLHHQTVGRLGHGLVATAHADDGVVEGVEYGDRLAAVQWHPEMLPTRPNDPIFRWIVERARSA